ncbi:MAG: hypothetical protein HUU01_14095 [Saprospiraceae bacterium]|nr:hypothetical protein [Saprospiraceae bacterium]
MQQQDVIQKIQNLIAEGETEQAIDELVEFSRTNNPELYENAILLSGQYKQWKRENMLGIEQTNSELRRIEMGLLELLRSDPPADDHHDNKTAHAATSSSGRNTAKKRWLIGGVLGIIVLIIFVWMATGGEDTESSAPDTPEQAMENESSGNTPFTRLQIKPGTELEMEQEYPTEDNRFYLILLEDGNLCVHSSDDDGFKWGTRQESGIFAQEARFDEDGNLEINDANNRIWSTQTTDPDASLAVSNDGVLLVVNDGGEVLWEGKH